MCVVAYLGRMRKVPGDLSFSIAMALDLVAGKKNEDAKRVAFKITGPCIKAQDRG